jgi:TM2 domain-containing membrane protein YozV
MTDNTIPDSTVTEPTSIEPPVALSLDPEMLFKETVTGRFPVSDQPSAARHWTHTDEQTEGAYVPRPDRGLNTLRGLSIAGILGLDHFYLRSPLTGVVKMLTVGGFLLWWLWDIGQVWFNGDRVVNYGLGTPFNPAAGIGQGMVTDKSTVYDSKVGFSSWAAATTVGGFMGADYMFFGKPHVFIMVAISGAIVLSYLSYILKMESFMDILSFGGIMSLIFLATLGVGVFSLWVSKMKAVLKPEKLVREGVTLSENTDKTLNWFMRLVRDKDGNVKEGYEDYNEILTKYCMVTDIPGKGFVIEHNANIPPDVKTQSPAGFPPVTILVAIFWNIVDVFTPLFCAVFPAACLQQKLRSMAQGAIGAAMKGDFAGAVGSVVKGASGIAGTSGGIGKAIRASGDLGGVAKAALGSKMGETVGSVMKGDLGGVAKAALGSKMDEVIGSLSQNPLLKKLDTKSATQSGGGSELSTESKIIGAVVATIIAGGAIKGIIDHITDI